MHAMITLGHAKALLAASPTQKHVSILEAMVKKKGVSHTEQLVQTGGVVKSKANEQAIAKDPDIVRLKKKLGEVLGSNVAVQHHRGLGYCG